MIATYKQIAENECYLEPPFMDQNEIEAVKICLDIFNKPINALEWGSGKSTLFFSCLLQQGSSWLALEHDPSWFHEVKTKIDMYPSTCASITLVQPDKEFDRLSDGDYATFRNYVLSPASTGSTFDFILVDGRARVECMAVGWEMLKDEGVMVLHDAQRHHYSPGIPKDAFIIKIINPQVWIDDGAITTLFMFKQQKLAVTLIENLENLLVSGAKLEMVFPNNSPPLCDVFATSHNNYYNWNRLQSLTEIKLYAGDVPDQTEYDGWIGLSLTQENARHIRHDVTKPFPLPNNSVDAFQAEDVFEHIEYDQLVPVLNDIHRVLKPGALFRLSLPDYRCDILYERSEKDSYGNIIFDPFGGGNPEKPGHVWFPRYETLQLLLETSRFGADGTINFLHYYDRHGASVTHPIDYSKGHVQRTPDFDRRVQAPYRSMSLIVDLTKGKSTVTSQAELSDKESSTIPGISSVKISFVMIVLNGMPFIKCALKAIYDAAHEIIIVEGAVDKCSFAANPDGSSVDGTVDCIRCFPDPAGKIRLIQGMWPEKCEMQNAAISYVTGNYVWLVDSDEIYKSEHINKIRSLLADDPAITQVNFIPDNFWRGFDYLLVSPRFLEPAYHYRRLFKFKPGSRFSTHRPPTMLWPDTNRSTEDMKLLDGTATRKMGIYPFHYSYVLKSQVFQKIELYRRYGWGECWCIDLEEWYRECFLKWAPSNRELIEKNYPVWTGGESSHTIQFHGEHPVSMNDLIFSLNQKGVIDMMSEEDFLPIIGDTTYLKRTLDSWHHIELDPPLQTRVQTIQKHISSCKPFWNNHVALAFFATKLQPKSYLEVGVRTGGSMVQVLGAAYPERVVAIDLWDGNYASFPNYLEYTKKQLQDFQLKSGKTYNIEYIQGNSHEKLKSLIKQSKTFDLITIDGDHSLEGAQEDLEDAFLLLAERGAIIFDDIIHASFPFLLGLAHSFVANHPELSLVLNTTQDNGCAVFLKNVRINELTQKEIKRVKVAGDYDHGQNLTKVSTESKFASAIKELFTNLKPTKIIETGTYQGEGTTNIIATTLRDLKIPDSTFYTIECNPPNFNAAISNLAASRLLSFVKPIKGISLPRHLLPTQEKIEEDYVHNLEFNDIFIDHREHNRAELYYKETNFEDVPDDLLGKSLKLFNYAPDFVLLDSGGHIGHIEFTYLLRLLQAPCFIALDDIYHVKHHKSFLQIQSDPRFTMITVSDEKFGFCISRFIPENH